jgi:hypothetical protein
MRVRRAHTKRYRVTVDVVTNKGAGVDAVTIHLKSLFVNSLVGISSYEEAAHGDMDHRG